MIDRLAAAIRKFAPDAVLLHYEPMARHTSFKVGGPADLMFFPQNENQVAFALNIAKKHGVGVQVIGKGTNLLVRDGGIRGLVIKLDSPMAGGTIYRGILRAQAGASLKDICLSARNNELAGLEFACGIPGSIGGAVAMNAGAYDGEIKDVLVGAQVLLDGQIEWWPLERMDCGYRTTLPLRLGGVILEAAFKLKGDDPAAITARMAENDQRRRDKQPLDDPSAGSTFKRPPGKYAGPLIDECALRGARLGGAQVSEKHAGFIINAGGATARDILDLIALVQEKVYAQHGVTLEPEVRILGED